MSVLSDRPVVTPTLTTVAAGRKARNAVATVLVSMAFLIALVPLVWVVYTLIDKGASVIAHADWWNKSLDGLTGNESGGGVYHAIYGTLLQGLICAVIAVPLGIMVAIMLVEYGAGSRLARLTTFMVDILTGVPSIVAALFIYALWITTLDLQRSAFAVSLALVLLMIPIVVRTTEEMLRIVPDDLREASYALGVPKWKTIVSVVLPTALSGIITGIMLSVARVMGETAPVLVLVGYSASINYNPADGNMASLPLLMAAERNTPGEVGDERIWGAALTLVLIITVFNVIAGMISRRTAITTR